MNFLKKGLIKSYLGIISVVQRKETCRLQALTDNISNRLREVIEDELMQV